MKVNRFDANVRVEGVLVEENRTTCEVRLMTTFMKDSVVDVVRSFLQGNNMPFHRNLFLKCVFLSTSGSRVPVVDAEPLLHR